MQIALFQPDIPQNTAAIIRLGACLGVAIDIVEPCGFLFSDAGFRRTGMDYLEVADVTRHPSWNAFLAGRNGRACRDEAELGQHSQSTSWARRYGRKSPSKSKARQALANTAVFPSVALRGR